MAAVFASAAIYGSNFISVYYRVYLLRNILHIVTLIKLCLYSKAVLKVCRSDGKTIRLDGAFLKIRSHCYLMVSIDLSGYSGTRKGIPDPRHPLDPAFVRHVILNRSAFIADGILVP